VRCCNECVFGDVKSILDLRKDVLPILFIFFYKETSQCDFHDLVRSFDLIIRKGVVRDCKAKFDFALLEHYDLEFARKFGIAIRDYLDR